MAKSQGQRKREKARAGWVQPIHGARPLSLTPATSDLAPLVQRPSFRFHDPKGGVLKARLVFKRPTFKRWGKA